MRPSALDPRECRFCAYGLIPLNDTRLPPHSLSCPKVQLSLAPRCSPATPTTITLAVNQTVLVNGTLTLLPDTVTVIYIGGSVPAPIVVTGSILLDGVLTIVLSGAAFDGQIIPVISASGSGEVNGTYSAIVIESQRRGCNKVSGEAVASAGGGLSVLVRVAKKKCGLSGGAIAGIVVGAVLCLAAVAVVVLLVLRRARPHHPMFNARSDKDSGWR